MSSQYIPKLYILHGQILDNDRRMMYAHRGWEGYPTFEEMSADVKHIATMWNKANADDRIVLEMQKLLAVSPDYDFEMYVCGAGFNLGMSNPLLITLYWKGEKGMFKYSDNVILDTIIHELTHRFIASPRKEKYVTAPYWDYVREKYQEYEMDSQNHFLVYAVLEKVLPLVFSNDEIQEQLDMEKSPGYRAAIDLVKEKGADHFIQEFKERVVYL